MKKYTLSAVVLASNSEKKIEACLRSLVGWADEVIVVDGQSKDKTAQIAQQYGATVYSHAFLGSFAAERNFGTDKAKSDWVLQMDSDEVVTVEFKKKCDEILPVTEHAAFKFLRKNNFLGHTFEHGGWHHWSQHLFRRTRARYEGRVHEHMNVQGTVGNIDADMLHFPFDNLTEFIERQNRYTTLQAADILDSEEVDIKKIRYNITWKPLKLFKKMYLSKKAYKEGFYGLLFTLLFVWVHFLKWAKVWEKKYSKTI